jgi:hypothetical protein
VALDEEPEGLPIALLTAADQRLVGGIGHQAKLQRARAVGLRFLHFRESLRHLELARD